MDFLINILIIINMFSLLYIVVGVHLVFRLVSLVCEAYRSSKLPYFLPIFIWYYPVRFYLFAKAFLCICWPLHLCLSNV